MIEVILIYFISLSLILLFEGVSECGLKYWGYKDE